MGGDEITSAQALQPRFLAMWERGTSDVICR
jgi:hypothetical protein